MKESNKIIKITSAMVSLVAVIGLSAATFAHNEDDTNVQNMHFFERYQFF